MDVITRAPRVFKQAVADAVRSGKRGPVLPDTLATRAPGGLKEAIATVLPEVAHSAPGRALLEAQPVQPSAAQDGTRSVLEEQPTLHMPQARAARAAHEEQPPAPTPPDVPMADAEQFAIPALLDALSAETARVPERRAGGGDSYRGHVVTGALAGCVAVGYVTSRATLPTTGAGIATYVCRAYAAFLAAFATVATGSAALHYTAAHVLRPTVQLRADRATRAQNVAAYAASHGVGDVASVSETEYARVVDDAYGPTRVLTDAAGELGRILARCSTLCGVVLRVAAVHAVLLTACLGVDRLRRGRDARWSPKGGVTLVATTFAVALLVTSVVS